MGQRLPSLKALICPVRHFKSAEQASLVPPSLAANPDNIKIITRLVTARERHPEVRSALRALIYITFIAAGECQSRSSELIAQITELNAQTSRERKAIL